MNAAQGFRDKVQLGRSSGLKPPLFFLTVRRDITIHSKKKKIEE
jgi:hypothetical protein